MSRALWVIGCIVGLAVASGNVLALEECERYVQGEGNQVSVRQDCMEEMGLPILYVQKGEDGFEVVAPIPEDVTWEPLWKATLDWLASAANMDALEEQIELAAIAAASDAEVLDGKISQIEYINYAVGDWLLSSGNAAVVTQSANGSPPPQTTGRCSQIPVCTSCQIFSCGQIGPWNWCNCYAFGQSCCVINPQPV